MDMTSDIRRLISEFISKQGMGRSALSLADNLGIKSVSYNVEVGEKIRNFEIKKEDIRGYVLLPLTQGGYYTNAYRFCLFAHAFKTRGYQPVIPICYQDLAFCHRNDDSKVDQYDCDNCHIEGKKLLSDFGLDSVEISEVISTDRDLEVNPDLETYRGVPVAKYAKSSTQRVRKKYTLDQVDQQIYLGFLKSAVTLVDVAESLIDAYNVVATLADHQSYIYGGIYMEVSHKHDIPTYSEAVGQLDESIVFGRADNKTPFPFYSDQSIVNKHLNEPLTDTELNEVNNRMEKRRSGEQVYQRYSKNTNKAIDANDSQCLVGIFTNLIWDASHQFSQGLFEDYLNWLDQTINRIKPKTESRIIIKTHPAEQVRGTNESVSEHISEHHSDLPSHIEIMPPDTEVDTYSLINQLDAGIVYNSTVGLELAYWNTPVIVAGDSHYRGYGFTHDPETEQEYFDYIDKIGNLPYDNNMQKLARRYCYYFYQIKHLDFPYISTGSNMDSVDLLPVSHSDITQGNGIFDTVVESILNDNPVVQRDR